MKNITIILFAVLALALQSCEKVINVDLKNAIPQLVIEGGIDNAGNPAIVKLTKSINFSANNIFPGVSGATIKISDNVGNDYVLTETPINSGIYKNNTAIGVIGNTYTMTVISEGKTYTATSKMPRQMPIDTLIQDVFDAGTPSGIVKSVNLLFQDLPGYGDNAHVLQKINGVPEPLVFGIGDDKFSDGGIAPFQIVNTDKKLKVGDVVQLELRFVDRNIFKYLNGILENAQNNSVPANPTSNISGGALGYFSAHTSETKTIIIN